MATGIGLIALVALTIVAAESGIESYAPTRLIVVDDGYSRGRLALGTPWRNHFCYNGRVDESINAMVNESFANTNGYEILSASELKNITYFERATTWIGTKNLFYLASNESLPWNAMIVVVTRPTDDNTFTNQDCFVIRYPKSSKETATLMTRIDAVKLGPRKSQLNSTAIELELCLERIETKTRDLKITSWTSIIIGVMDILLILTCAVLALFLYLTSREHREELQQCRARNELLKSIK